MKYLIVFVISYLLGTSNMAYYISRRKGVDFKKHGSKNLGASNATMLLGWRAGILVGAHDIGKALLAVGLTHLLFPGLACGGAVAGVAAVLGHIFPFYLHFSGGKGLAPFIGMALALNWKLALLELAVAVILVLITDYMVAGTTTMILGMPAAMFFQSHNLMLVCILLTATAVVIYKHRDNYVRIAKGTEIRFRGASKGDHRIQ